MENRAYYLYIPAQLRWDEVRDLLPLLGEERRQRIERLRFEKDKLASLLAQSLLHAALEEMTGEKLPPLEFSYHAYGKPFLPQFPQCDFSLSHTDGCVAVAVAQGRVGVDVERVKSAHDALAARFFHPQERQWMAQQDDRARAFYEIWTKKEAYLKMCGTGLHTPLQSFSTLCCEEKMQTVQLPEHTLSLCASGEIVLQERAFARLSRGDTR